MTITPPALNDLTTTALDGAGVFDTLMRAAKGHLELEFKQGRIRGPEYATVYLGSMEQVLQSSLQFLLAKDKVGLEAQVLEKQLAIADVQLEIEQVKLQQETKQLAILDATLCKLNAEFDVLVATRDKSAKETELLTWKITTEKAQTLAAGVEDNSVIGRQKILFKAQSDGFARDAEQKVAKLLIDSWSVRRTTDEATVADGVNQLADSVIGRSVTKMLVGIGA